MGDTDISPGIEEEVDQGNARNQTLRPERLKGSSPDRAVPPKGIIHSQLNPFVLCRVLSQRARQLAVRTPGKPFSQVIKITREEFREGKLQYVIPQFSPQPAGSANRRERGPMPKRRKKGLSEP